MIHREEKAMKLKLVMLAALWCTCGLLVSRGTCAEDGQPIGPYQIELIDKTSVSGMLYKMDDKEVVMLTADGYKTFERRRVKSDQPLEGKAAEQAAAQANQGKRFGAERQNERSEKPAEVAAVARPDDLKIGKTPPKDFVIDDVPDPVEPIAVNNPQPVQNEVMLKLKAADPLAKAQPEKSAQPVPNGGDRGNIDRALTYINTGAYRQAATALRSVVLKSSEEDVRAADALMRQKFNKPLSEVMVMCYTLSACSPCRGEGTIKCDLCMGSGYLNKNIAAPGGGALGAVKRAVVANGQSRPRVSLCDKCRGNGFDICVTCSGTCQAFAEPTPYEREAYGAYMIRMATETVCTSESNYGDTGREPMPTIMPNGDANIRGVVEQVWLRDTADRVKSDVMRLWRAEGFFSMALKGDPGLAIRSPKDLKQEINKIRLRRQTLYGELSERLRFQDFNIHE
jgi:hypothetical protein